MKWFRVRRRPPRRSDYGAWLHARVRDRLLAIVALVVFVPVLLIAAPVIWIVHRWRGR